MWFSLRNRLATRNIVGDHECALVLSVDGALKEFVETERRRFGTDEVIRRQLDPHITLLYGGFQPPEALRRLETLSAEFSGVELDFELGHVASFTNRNGFITNIHYRVHSATLQALHMQALRGFENLGLALQTPYAGAHYVPHLSIFDRVLLPRDLPTLIALPEHKAWRAGGCQLIGEAR